MIHKVVAVVGVILLAVLFYRLGPSDILSFIRVLGWGFPVMVLIFGVQEVVRSIAVLKCLSGKDLARLREILRIRFVGEAIRQLTLTGPVLSEPTRAWLLSRQVARSANAYAATLAEYLAFSFVSAAMVIVAMAYFLHRFELIRPVTISANILLYGSMGYLVAAAYVLIRRAYLIGPVIKALAGFPIVGKRLKVDEIEVHHMEETLLRSLRDRPGTFVQVMVLETLAHTLLVLETYWVMASMKLSFPLYYAPLVESVTKVVNMALFIGASEGAYAIIFDSIGLASAAGFTLSLAKRLRSLAVAAVGLGSLTFMPERPLRNVLGRPPVRTDL
jgi:hypothetical protein